VSESCRLKAVDSCETRDFREKDILSDFCKSLEGSLQKQLTESGLYMGASSELVRTVLGAHVHLYRNESVRLRSNLHICIF